VGAVIIPVVLLITHAGGLVFSVFVAAVAGLGCYEFYRMFSRTDTPTSTAVGIAGSVGLCLSFHFEGVSGAGYVLSGLLGVVLVERLITQRREAFVSSVGVTMIGALYTGWLLGYFILIRNFNAAHAWPYDRIPEAGRTFVYLVLVLTWSYDSMAYLVGSFAGRHRIFGKVSPSKTVEGTLGGLAGCVAASLISRVTFASFIGPGQAVILGLLVGILAQIGDLVESMIKRSTDTKDSSRMLPGHGGVLDRYDSLLFTGPGLYLFLRTISTWNGP
jgi:phosphatidate cytidylyltransferase